MGSADERERRQKMAQQKRTQARANTPAWLATLAALAIVSFVVLAWAIAQREAHASGWAGLTSIESSGAVAGSDGERTGAESAAAPLSVLARGIERDASTAIWSLQHDRMTAASVAMDGAMRSAMVGRDAAAGASQRTFERALQLVRDARRARQNGDPVRAAATLQRLSGTLVETSGASTLADSSGTRIRVEPGSYDGVRLLNAAGMPLGVVDRVSPGGANGPGSAVLVLGGYHHVLGFLDFGGTRVDAPASRLLFGEPQTVGATYVVLSTLADTPDAALRDLSAPAMTTARAR